MTISNSANYHRVTGSRIIDSDNPEIYHQAKKQAKQLVKKLAKLPSAHLSPSSKKILKIHPEKISYISGNDTF